MTYTNIGNCFDDCYNECREDEIAAANSLLPEPNKTLENSGWSNECNDLCNEQVGARDATCGSERSWIAAAAIFMIIRLIIIGLKGRV